MEGRREREREREREKGKPGLPVARHARQSSSRMQRGKGERECVPVHMEVDEGRMQEEVE